MEKFLAIEVTSVGLQLIALKDILTITSASDTAADVVITYINDTVVTITSAAQVQFDQRDMIVSSVIAALNSSYTHVTYEPVLPRAVSAIVIS
tara:strand:- start:1976 stop:2254 length:279 start_codon:yes stop_codon:yes gene_type:complete